MAEEQEVIYRVVDVFNGVVLGLFSTRYAAGQYRQEWIADHPGVWGQDSGLDVDHVPLNPRYGEDS